MALMATEDPTSTHPTDSNDAPVGRLNEAGSAPREEGTADAVKPAIDPLDSGAMDPYDNIACTD
jgi:hypothetical protein